MNEQLSFNLDVQTGDAVKNVDALQVSIDDLTKVMGDNVKTGGKLVKTMADNSKQTSVLTKELTDLIRVMNESAKATEDNTAATMLGAEETEKATGAMKAEIAELRLLVTSLKEAASATREAAVADEEMATASKAATGEKAKTTSILSKISSLGTPEFLKAATWSTLAVGGVAYEAIKNYTQFNAALTQSITQAGRAPGSLPFLTNEAVNIAKNTGIHLTDVANILYRVSSATASWNGGLGATNKQLGQMASQVANLNVLGGVAGGAPSEQSARVIGAIMNANLQGIGTDPKKAAAWVNAAVGGGDIKQSEFISAMGRGLLASLSAHNISASSGASFVDLLTTLGTPGSTAGQYAKTALTLMTAPSAQGSAAMSMIGVSTGQLGALLSGKGGITAAAEYLHQALQRFNPSAFKETTTTKDAQGKSVVLTGAAAARAQIEKWATGTIPQKVLDEWTAGKLGSMSAAALGTTTSGANGTAVSGAQWLNTLQNLIVTKAYGGSRSSATIDALIMHPGEIAGIQAYIDRNSTEKKLNQDLAIANATPQAQFRRMEQTFMGQMVKLGQEITPTAIKLSKVLLGVVDGLLKMKFVLVPLVTAIGIMGASALVIKGAGVLQGGMRVFGAGAGALSRLYGRIAGPAEEGIARTGPAKFFESLSRGTGMFASLQTPADKMNMAADKMLEAAGISKSVGGGGGGNLFKKLFKRGETTALSDAEKAVVGKGESALAGDAAGFVAKEALPVAEKVGGGLLSRFAGAGLGDLVGGVVGGPVGAVVMATVGPMLMPYIAKGIGSAVGGIGHLFGSLFSSSTPKTPAPKPISVAGVMTGRADLRSEILVAQAQNQGIAAKIAAGTATSADYASFYTNTGNIRNWQQQDKLFGNMSDAQSAKKAQLANLATYKSLTTEQGALGKFVAAIKGDPNLQYGNNETMKQFLAQNPDAMAGLPKNAQAAFAKIMNNSSLTGAQKTAQIAALTQSTQSAISNQISKMPMSQALKTVKSITASQLSVDGPTASLTREASKKNLTVAQATSDYAKLTRMSIQSALDSRMDTKAAAAQASLGNTQAAAALKVAAAKLKAQAETSAALAENVASKNNLNQQNMTALGAAVETSFTKAITAAGLTQSGMATAFSTALGHGGLSGAVSRIIKQGMTGKP